MKKPEQKQIKATFWDYFECRDFLQDKFKYDESDYAKSFDHFDHYQKVTGDLMPCGGKYPDVSRAGSSPWTTIRDGRRVKCSKEEYDADFKLIHEHFQRYQSWTENNPQPEFQNFWHWVIDRHEVRNGSDIYFSKEVYDEMVKDCKTPEWVLEIYKRYLDEFADKYGELVMRCEW